MAASPFRMSCWRLRVTPAQPKSFGNTTVPFLRRLGAGGRRSPHVSPSREPGGRAVVKHPGTGQGRRRTKELSVPEAVRPSALTARKLHGRGGEKSAGVGGAGYPGCGAGALLTPPGVFAFCSFTGSLGGRKPSPGPPAGPHGPQ